MGMLGGYPAGVTDAHIEAYFGKPISDHVADATEFHSKVQKLRMELVEFIKSQPDVLCADLNEGLLAACEDAAFSEEVIAERLQDAEADRVEDERQAAADYQNDLRWEYDS